ncbi:MAG: hypothetical protein D3910_16860, partial [Candidatus Electrothrix sp. ATG2]|nr:hypothetical protein [Candidatus Electrothrix sp. ATG2]
MDQHGQGTCTFPDGGVYE